ncbi:MAG: YHS domain-containing protein [Acidobacteria bacterium]|nr:YHS domain-containing protein [Acidobacteriota bacterium]
MTKRVLLAVAAALAAVTMLVAEVDLSGAKCPIAGEQAMKGLSVDYKGGKVYFCCAGCPDAFQQNPASYAVQANKQLFVTGQAKQIACPFSGSKADSSKTVMVDGKPVAFCCDNCKGKAEKAGEKLDAMIFSDEAFDKAFQVGD